jgi:hypothetical protein
MSSTITKYLEELDKIVTRNSNSNFIYRGQSKTLCPSKNKPMNQVFLFQMIKLNTKYRDK